MATKTTPGDVDSTVKQPDDKIFDDVHAEFGRIPEYLVEMNAVREARARADSEAAAKNTLERARAGRLSDTQKHRLIAALRQEHALLNASYQKLPFVVDTPSRRARKEEHERKLHRIERDFEALAARVVFVINDVSTRAPTP
jgi:nuclear pore complex protein Nup88